MIGFFLEIDAQLYVSARFMFHTHISSHFNTFKLVEVNYNLVEISASTVM